MLATRAGNHKLGFAITWLAGAGRGVPVRWRPSHDWLARPYPHPKETLQFLGINRKRRNSRKSPPLPPFLLRPCPLFSPLHLPNPVARVLDLVRLLRDSEPLNCLVLRDGLCMCADIGLLLVLLLCWQVGRVVDWWWLRGLSMRVDLSPAGGCADGRLRNPGARSSAAAEI